MGERFNSIIARDKGLRNVKLDMVEDGITVKGVKGLIMKIGTFENEYVYSLCNNEGDEIDRTTDKRVMRDWLFG